MVLSTSFPTSSLSHKYENEEALISLFFPYSNGTKNFLFPTKTWTHTATAFLFHLVLPSLLLFYISLTFKTYPTLILVLIRFFSFIYFIVFITGKIMVYFGYRGEEEVLLIVIEIIKSTSELGFLCEN